MTAFKTILDRFSIRKKVLEINPEKLAVNQSAELKAALATKAPGPALEAAIAAAAEGKMPSAAGSPVLVEPAVSIEMKISELIDSGYLPPRLEYHKISHEFRAIKRILLGHLPGRCETPEPSANVIMVSSALPNEGKTTCTLNLAISFALERDYSVVLIDGDVINPTISRMLGIEQQPGLLDVLRDPSKRLNDVEIGTGIPGLTVIPAGQRGHDSPELLSSNRMMRLTAEMQKATNRLFVFDSTPILLTNESRALSEMAGQIAFVVRAGFTPKDAVKSALGFLPKDTYTGIILNYKVTHEGDEYYYTYSDYYVPIDPEEAA